jgi:hypothetical protein
MDMKLYKEWFEFLSTLDFVNPFEAAVLSSTMARDGLPCAEENDEDILALLDAMPEQGHEGNGPFKAVSVINDSISGEKSFDKGEDAVLQVTLWEAENSKCKWRGYVLNREGTPVYKVEGKTAV